MHLRNYERPEGYTGHGPEVLVAKPVVDKLGMPVVDHESLHQFLTDDLQIPYDQSTHIKLFGRSRNSSLLGFHVPYTHSIHVQANSSEARYLDTGGTMRVLAHEARHRSDSTNRKSLTAVEVGARWASYKAGFEVVHALPYISSLAILGGLKARSIWYKHEPAEKRARAQEEDPSTSDHSQDILFPNSPRTAMLAFMKEIPEDKLVLLGFSKTTIKLLSDFDGEVIVEDGRTED